MKKLTAKEAEKLAKKLGIDVSNDGITFYATNAQEDEIYTFDSKNERDNFVAKHEEVII